MGFEHHPLRTLNALQRLAHGVGQTAIHLKLHGRAEIVAGFVRTPETIQDQAAIVVNPRIAAAVHHGRVESIERFPQIPRKVRMHAAAVKLFEHAVLGGGDSRDHGQQGGKQRRFS
jgi:hypothetical protein